MKGKASLDDSELFCKLFLTSPCGLGIIPRDTGTYNADEASGLRNLMVQSEEKDMFKNSINVTQE